MQHFFSHLYQIIKVGIMAQNKVHIMLVTGSEHSVGVGLSGSDNCSLY